MKKNPGKYSNYMLQPQLITSEPQPGLVFPWKREMTTQERDEFIECAGDLLSKLG